MIILYMILVLGAAHRSNMEVYASRITYVHRVHEQNELSTKMKPEIYFGFLFFLRDFASFISHSAPLRDLLS